MPSTDVTTNATTNVTEKFLADHSGFIANHIINVPEILASGDRMYYLSEDKENCVSLQFSQGGVSMRAYLVNTAKNKKNKHTLPSEGDIYMITPPLRGSRFIVYQNDEHGITVEHNTFDDPAKYAERLEKVLKEHPVLFHTSTTPDDHGAEKREDLPAPVIQIVGRHTDFGWQFFVRDNRVPLKATLYGPFRA